MVFPSLIYHAKARDTPTGVNTDTTARQKHSLWHWLWRSHRSTWPEHKTLDTQPAQISNWIPVIAGLRGTGSVAEVKAPHTLIRSAADAAKLMTYISGRHWQWISWYLTPPPSCLTLLYIMSLCCRSLNSGGGKKKRSTGLHPAFSDSCNQHPTARCGQSLVLLHNTIQHLLRFAGRKRLEGAGEEVDRAAFIELTKEYMSLVGHWKTAQPGRCLTEAIQHYVCCACLTARLHSNMDYIPTTMRNSSAI